MKKIKVIFTNKKLIKILYYIFLLIFILISILNIELNGLDELWNFSSARNISNGLVPYKDFNVIVTPLSMFINSLILKISSTLLTFRIMYFLYYVLIIYLVSKILSQLKVKDFLKYIFTFILSFILVKVCYLDYNFIQLILIFLLIYLNIKNMNYDNKKLNILIPLISGLSIINKQSTGLIVASINIIIIMYKKILLKKNIKISFIIKQLLLTSIPVLLFTVYLLYTNSFNEFYDLAILGLTTFSNKLFMLPMLILILMIYLIILVLLWKNKKDLNLWIIFLYSLASLSVVVPILDQVHTILGISVALLFLIYIINNMVKDISSNYIYFLFPVLLILIILNITSYTQVDKITTGVYKYIPVQTEFKYVIEDVSDYILKSENNKNIHIMDFSSPVYNLNINRYDKYFDLFLYGNLGVKGQQEIKDIINKEKQIFLINNQVSNWQTPIHLIDYMKDKYEVCGSISAFSIYCKK